MLLRIRRRLSVWITRMSLKIEKLGQCIVLIRFDREHTATLRFTVLTVIDSVNVCYAPSCC